MNIPTVVRLTKNELRLNFLKKRDVFFILAGLPFDIISYLLCFLVIPLKRKLIECLVRHTRWDNAFSNNLPFGCSRSGAAFSRSPGF